MVVDISSKLDIKKLQVAIEEQYWDNPLSSTTGKHYIIMNKDTVNDLLEACSCTTPCRDNEIAMFQNFYIATCEALKYGQVDFK